MPCIGYERHIDLPIPRFTAIVCFLFSRISSVRAVWISSLSIPFVSASFLVHSIYPSFACTLTACTVIPIYLRIMGFVTLWIGGHKTFQTNNHKQWPLIFACSLIRRGKFTWENCRPTRNIIFLQSFLNFVPFCTCYSVSDARHELSICFVLCSILTAVIPLKIHNYCDICLGSAQQTIRFRFFFIATS